MTIDQAIPLGQQLIKRSTGLFNSFMMPVCTQIIERENLRNLLTEEDILTILKRYNEHISYWSSGFNIVIGELIRFSDVIGRDFLMILKQFIRLRDLY